ncbi:hypothetical protein [Amycolatopsis thermoflava]|uniref:hypothetical protein n=1 Tax=Amycolatopsis thermoflava TaxID=84480 RepID=UPI00365C3FFB
MTGDDNRDNRSGLGGGLAAAGLGLLMVLCCAGPALIAGGALGALGGAVRNPWLIAAGVLMVLAAVGYALLRRARRRSGQNVEDCCPPQPPARPRSAERPPARDNRQEGSHP